MGDVAALNITIGANLQQAIQGLEHLGAEFTELAQTGVTSISQLERAMKTLQATAAKTTDVGTLAKYNRALEQLAGESTRIKNIGLGDAIATSTNKAGLALTDFSRIVQDAPYVALSGNFAAIANNINPMIESFGRLKTSTGSTGGALKQMAAGLMGPGGIGIAVSLVSSALVLFGDKLFSTSKAADEAAKAIDTMHESAAKEILKLRELTTVAEDAGQSMKVRLAAVQKLQNEYPNYLGNLSNEAILSGNVGKAYEEINNALIAKATLQAAEEKIIPLLKQQVELTLKQSEADKFLAATSHVTAEELKKVPDLYVRVTQSRKESDKAGKDSAKLQEEINNIMGGLGDILSKVAPLDLKYKKEAAKEQKEINEGLTEELRLHRIIYESTRTAEISPLFDPVTFQKANAGMQKYFDDVKKGQEGMKEFNKQRSILPESFFEDLDKRTAKGLGRKTKEEMAAIIEQAELLQGVFENIFSDIAQNGKLSIETLMKSIEQLIIKLASAAAAAALLSVFTGGSFSAIFGQLSGFSGMFKGLAKTATGGIVTAPQARLVGEAGPEAIIPISRLREFLPAAGSQVVVMETQIRGDDLYLIQSRTAARRGRAY